MGHATKRILIIIGGAIGLLVLAAAVLPSFVDADRYKPRLEAAASDALGMDVRIAGRLGFGCFPTFHVTLEDGRILGDRGVAIASVKRAAFWVQPLPLLLGALRLRRVELTQPWLSIERDPEGRFNIDRLQRAAALLSALDGASVALSNATVVYSDRRSGERCEADSLDVAVRRVRLAAGRSPRSLKGLSLQAAIACKAIRARGLSVSDVRIAVDGKDGVFRLEPVTMRILGEPATASLRADASEPIPHCQVRCSLPRFPIAGLLEALSAKPALEGTMALSVSLSMQGTTRGQMVQTLSGEVSLRGRDLTLEGGDLDRRLSRFESSQNFNLVDVGAVFFAGPLGLAVTRGLSFASLFRGSAGSSRIGVLVSDWTVERGVAQAKDVALATSKNRIALQGRLDLVHERFEDMTMAVIDKEGRARVRQAIHGPFARPVVEKPRVLQSLAGPVVRLYTRTRGLFPAGPREVFYTGSVAAPD